MLKKSFISILLAMTVTANAASNQQALDLQLPSYQPKVADSAKQPTLATPKSSNNNSQSSQSSIPVTAPSDGGTSIAISGQQCRGSSGNKGNCQQLDVEKSFDKPSVSVGVEGGFAR